MAIFLVIDILSSIHYQSFNIKYLSFINQCHHNKFNKENIFLGEDVLPSYGFEDSYSSSMYLPHGHKHLN